MQSDIESEGKDKDKYFFLRQEISSFGLKTKGVQFLSKAQEGINRGAFMLE